MQPTNSFSVNSLLLTIKQFLDLFNSFVISSLLFISAYHINVANNKILDYFSAIVISSFVEETIRLTSFIIGLYFSLVPIVFTPLLAIVEFFIYIYNQKNLTAHFVSIRFVCIFLHFSCFFILYLFFNKFQKIRKEFSTKDALPYLFLGYLLAIILHVLWNTFLGGLVLNLIRFGGRLF